jgi:protein-histidine N-methyltransferase
MSPSSAEYRATAPDPAECPPADPTVPGELPITPSLKSAFTASIAKLGISLAFFSGSWESLTAHFESGATKHDIVLTSETIYRTEALPALTQLLRQACTESQPLCLVAAKVLYFGVGGGVSEFLTTLQSKAVVEQGCSGKAEVVWERKVGIGRKIMRIDWL